jgi:hypothetical protein
MQHQHRFANLLMPLMLSLQGPSIVSGNKGQTKSGQPVVVFIAKNSVSAIAVQVGFRFTDGVQIFTCLTKPMVSL